MMSQVQAEEMLETTSEEEGKREFYNGRISPKLFEGEGGGTLLSERAQKSLPR